MGTGEPVNPALVTLWSVELQHNFDESVAAGHLCPYLCPLCTFSILYGTLL